MSHNKTTRTVLDQSYTYKMNMRTTRTRNVNARKSSVFSSPSIKSLALSLKLNSNIYLKFNRPTNPHVRLLTHWLVSHNS